MPFKNDESLYCLYWGTSRVSFAYQREPATYLLLIITHKIAAIWFCPDYLPICLLLSVLWFDSERYSLNLRVVWLDLHSLENTKNSLLDGAIMSDLFCCFIFWLVLFWFWFCLFFFFWLFFCCFLCFVLFCFFYLQYLNTS